MYNEVELWLFPDTDISELRAVPGPKAPGLGEFECTRKHRVLAAISKLRSAFLTGYKNKFCTYHNWERASVASEANTLL